MRQAATYPLALARVWIDRLRNAQAHHHAIARGMAWVIVFVLVASAARGAREMAIAYRYGAGPEVDAYLFVLALVSWPIGSWFSVLSVVLVPLASRIRQWTPQELSVFRAELLGFTLLLGSGLGFLGWFGLPWLLKSPWVGLPVLTSEIAARIVFPMSLLLPLGMLVSLLSAWMLADGRHANTLLESVPAIALILILIAGSGRDIEPLVWGTLAGFGCHLVSLGLFLNKSGEVDLPRFTRYSSQWGFFLQSLGIVLIGQALMSFAGVIDQFFAAHLGTGAIAKLNYANRLLTVILSLGATAVSRATLPVFSQELGGPTLRHVAKQWMRILFGVGVIGVMIGWLFAPWVVHVVFEHGEFTAQDTFVVTEIFQYGLVQVPFYFSGIVLVSMLASQSRYRVIATISASLIVIKILANIFLVSWLGLKGIVLATACMYAGSMLLCWLIANKDP